MPSLLAVIVCLTFFEFVMDKVSLRQIIAALNKGGDLPSWISLQEIQECIVALKQGRKNYTGEQFFAYAIEEDGILSNILFIRSNREATMLLRLLQEPGDE